MSDLDFRKKVLIKEIVDNPLFEGMYEDLRNEIVHQMIDEEDENKRTALHYENKALTRIMGKLIRIANDVRMTNAA